MTCRWWHWWSKSHIGHLPEAAVDALAKGYVKSGAHEPVPHRRSRHVSLRFYAKKSERDYMLTALNLHWIRSKYQLGDDIRCDLSEEDALRSMKLCERDVILLLQLRGSHAPLQASRVYPDTGPRSAGALLRAAGCPCGCGTQNRAHIVWQCELPEVQRLRRSELLPAVRELNARLELCDTVAGKHFVCSACLESLELRAMPSACSGIIGTEPFNYNVAEMSAMGVRFLLGVTQISGTADTIAYAMRAYKRVVRAVLDMVRAAIASSRSVTLSALTRAHRLQQLDHAWSQIRVHTWLHPRPAGGECKCCSSLQSLLGGHVLRHGEDGAYDGPVLPTVHPISARAATVAAMRGDIFRESAAHVSGAIRRGVRRLQEAAQRADGEASGAAAALARADASRPIVATVVVDHSQRVMDSHLASDEARRATARAAAAQGFLVWWLGLVTFHTRRDARRRRKMAASEGAAAQARSTADAARQLGRKRQARARAEAAEAATAAIRVGDEVCARAAAAYDAHVRCVMKRGREASKRASMLCAEVWEREAKRQRMEWMSPAWGATWHATWSAVRASGAESGIL